MKGFTLHNKIRLIHAGTEFFSLLKDLINQAKHSIHLQTYIFNNDQTGNEIAEALIEAAKRKVKVFVLADGFASKGLPATLLKKMQDAGIFFRFFEPLFSSKTLYLGRRLHHKVVVTDGFYSLVGGMNIADRYNDLPGIKSWFDLALYAEGEVSADLYKTCWLLWERKPARRFQLPNDIADKIKTNASFSNGQNPVRMRRNDWVKRKNQVWKTYMELLRTSEHSVTIMSSYFLPGFRFRMALKRALKRGVTIRVIAAGLSDIKIVKWAERYLYRWMLRNNIEVYEYQPCVLHAKMGIADDKLFTIGSYNVNDLSAYASIELNLDVKEPEFCKKVQAELNSIIEKDCTKISSSNYPVNLFSIRQFVQWGSFQAIRFMLLISTFYFRQRE
jgi:cardiolipin synthase